MKSEIMNTKRKTFRAAKPTKNRAWTYLVISGLIEIYWAYGLKAGDFGVLTLGAILLSFELLIRAVKTIPIGTAYAIFTSIGVVGTVVVGLVVFDEPVSILKLAFIALLGLCVIGLKFTGGDNRREVAE
jgi:multidrug transporter EmrE-like cation transporter